jgi:hypothetical protein
VEAEFSARLEQAELVAGEAQLQIEQQTTEPAILELEPCTLAISSPRGPDESAPPARLGVDAGGKLAVVVEPRAEQAHSVLGFRWSLRGARDPAGALIFDLKTPLCPTTRLKLDLPADHIPLSAQALITRLEPTAEQQTAQRVTWLLEYAGGVPGSLSIVPTATLAQSPQFVLLKQTAVHEATPQCLESSFDLDLDVYHGPLRQLTLAVDEQLHITSIRLGERELVWQAQATEEGQPHQLLIEFAEPLQGVNRVLHVSGISPLMLDETWRLPNLHPEETHWQEGTITLNVSPALELRRLDARGCRQTKATVPPTLPDGESHAFQCYQADGGLEVELQRQSARLRGNSGLTLYWDDAVVNGRLAVEIAALQGQTHRLTAPVPAAWTIDSVESLPASALEDWQITASGPYPQLLDLRLAEGLTPQRNLTLIVAAHRRAPDPTESLSPDDFRLATFQQLAATRRVIALHAPAPRQLRLEGDGDMERLDAESLTTEERALVDATAARLIFVQRSAGAGLRMKLRNENPRFAADVRGHRGRRHHHKGDRPS